MTVADAPMRIAVRAQSMAALPPPMMTTRSPSFTGSPARLGLQEMQRAEDALQLVAGHTDLRFLPGAE